MTQYTKLLALILLTLLTSCISSKQTFEPSITPTVTQYDIEKLPSPFPPLTFKEKNTAWGQELHIGQGFAKTLDLYKAITSFQRALFLIPKKEEYIKRSQELQFDIALCYFIGKKYQQVVETFENSNLRKVTSSFPAFQQLLIILYASYEAIGDKERGETILKALQDGNPNTAYKLELFTSIKKAQIQESIDLAKKKKQYQSVETLLNKYQTEKKSVKTAWMRSLILPGAGYWYVGQKASAVTSFIMNSLFIWAAVEFYSRGYTAAGIITTSFELGWYLGGSNGAGLAANQYNERLYEKYASKALTENKLFPLFQLNYGF